METSYLLDTHVLLWSLYERRNLRRPHDDILESDALTFVSAATVWEVEIKKNSGGLPVPHGIWEQCAEVGHRFLPIGIDHARTAGALPLLHRDPFDRMLIAQAQIDGLTILTVDQDFARYAVALA